MTKRIKTWKVPSPIVRDLRYSHVNIETESEDEQEEEDQKLEYIFLSHPSQRPAQAQGQASEALL